MRKVDPPSVDDEQVYHEIAAAKQEPQKTLLVAVQQRVLGAYAAYADAAPDVARLPAVSLTRDEKVALVHAYNHKTVPFASLRKHLMRPVRVARCPFCGISEASTLDHYLPKEQHPQFAVYSRNLVPCCGHCNGKKGELILNRATDVRFFLHPYFDCIPEEKFVSLQIKLRHDTDTLVLTYRLQCPEAMQYPVFQHLESHFRLLDLANRYSVMSLDHLRSERGTFERYYHSRDGGSRGNARQVAAELAMKADDYERDFGPNYWYAVLYRGLAAHAEFCDGGFRLLSG